MVEIYIAILFCANIAHCSPGANTQFLVNKSTQKECEDAGIEFLRTAGTVINTNHVIVCVKGVKLK